MRRMVAAVTVILLILLMIPAPAFADSGRLYADYVPRSQRGTVFYLEIRSDIALSAAEIELDYSDSLAQYRGYDAVGDTSYLKLKESGGRLTFLFCDSAGCSGMLFRLRFKAIGSGDAAFTLRMTEGVDADLRRVEPPPAFSLSLTLSGRTSVSRKGASSGASYSGAKSGKGAAETVYAVGSTSDEARSAVHDLSRPRTHSIVLICCGAAAAAALLVALGFLLGKRSKKKKRPAPETGEEAKDEETVDPGES